MTASQSQGLAPADIAICGGGMVGLSAALALAKCLPKKHILVLDTAPLVSDRQPYQPSFDARSTAISSQSAEFLETLGVWQRLATHVTAIEHVHVSDRGHLGTAQYSREDNSGRALGYVVDNAWLGRVLIAAVEAVDNISCLSPAEVGRIVPQARGAQLDVMYQGTNMTLDVALAIVADGAESRLRRQLVIAADVHEYDQAAVIANVSFDKAHEGKAFERFTAQGPVAMLPRGESPKAKTAALVWTWPRRDLPTVSTLSDEDFLAALQRRFGYRLGRITTVGERHVYPLKRVLAKEQVRSGLVLLGNAAHLLHPVAGQGFNLALRDCDKLAHALAQAEHSKQWIGGLAVLEKYLSEQTMDQYITSAVSHLFNDLFTSVSAPKELLRNTGLLALNAIPPARKAFFERMMGKTTLLP